MCHINVTNSNLHSLKKNSLQRHIKSVHQNVSYQCDECKSRFTQRISLQRRIQSVHQNIALKCEECDSIFTQQVKLDIHVEPVHKKKKKLLPILR